MAVPTRIPAGKLISLVVTLVGSVLNLTACGDKQSRIEPGCIGCGSSVDSGTAGGTDSGAMGGSDAGPVGGGDGGLFGNDGGSAGNDGGSIGSSDGGTTGNTDGGSSDAGNHAMLDGGFPDSGPVVLPGNGPKILTDAGPPPGGTHETEFVSTIAGGHGQYFQDGSGPLARFNNPQGIATDSTGNIYVSDTQNQMIRKIDTHGIVSTLAGSFTQGFADGDALSAQFSSPAAIAVGSGGNVFVADPGNNCIRKIVTSNGATIVSTLAGNGTPGATDGTGGSGGSAEFNGPLGLTVDALGNVYVADTGNNRIRKIDTSGKVTTLAGNGTQASVDGTGGRHGTAEFSDVTAVAADSQGRVYVLDQGGVRQVDSSGNVITLNGTGMSAIPSGCPAFGSISAIAVDADDDLDITGQTSDTMSACFFVSHIAFLNMGTTLSRTVLAGSFAGFTDGPGLTAAFGAYDVSLGAPAVSEPMPITVRADKTILVVDSGNDAIRTIDVQYNVTTLAGGSPNTLFTNGTAPNGTSRFDYPAWLAVDSGGNVYVTDTSNCMIRKIEPVIGTVTTLAGNPSYPFINASSCGFSDGPAATALFDNPSGVVVDGRGNVYVADTGNGRIRMIDSLGNVTTLAGSGHHGSADGRVAPNSTATFDQPKGLALDSDRNLLYITDVGNQKIRKIDLTLGVVSTVAGNGTAGAADGTGGLNGTAAFDTPMAITLDLDYLYVTDGLSGDLIRSVDSAGNVSTLIVADNASWKGIAADARGNLYVGWESSLYCLRRPHFFKVVGNGSGFVDGAVDVAAFSTLAGLAADANGNLYVADAAGAGGDVSSEIRLVTFVPAP